MVTSNEQQMQQQKKRPTQAVQTPQTQRTKALRFHRQFLERLQHLYGWLVGDCRRAPNGYLTEAAALRLVLEEGLRSFEAKAATETQPNKEITP
jgi:hypothetical protein